MIEGSLKSFLAEDLGYGDITTDSLIAASMKAAGHITCNESCVVAGLEETQILLELVGCTGTTAIRDGRRVRAGTTILRLSGPAGSILKAERTLLNLLSHMSGVATATSDLVQVAVKNGNTKPRIACTRKTLPGLRYFEKRAVELGGGDTHRLRLDDAVLIKENHLALAGTITDCVQRARARVSFTKKIEVEVTEPRQAVEAAQAGADIILLDNMKPEVITKTVSILREKGLRDRLMLEASGGIRKENLPSYIKTGVDVISVGAITHSVRSIDMSLELEPLVSRRK